MRSFKRTTRSYEEDARLLPAGSSVNVLLSEAMAGVVANNNNNESIPARFSTLEHNNSRVNTDWIQCSRSRETNWDARPLWITVVLILSALCARALL
jgi:hypothetical protein